MKQPTIERIAGRPAIAQPVTAEQTDSDRADDGDQPGADLVGGAQHDVRDGRRHGERVGADPGVPRAASAGRP